MPRKTPDPRLLETRLARAGRARRGEFEAARELLAALRTRGSTAFDELWELVARITSGEPPLYAVAHPSLDAFVKAELPGETRRSVRRNILVARSFSPEDEARHGIGFLEEAALYAQGLAGAAEPPAAIDLDRLTLVLRQPGGGTRRVKARQASIEELRRARRALRGAGGGGGRRHPAESALRAALRERPTLREVAVRANGRSASFGGVPLGALRELGRVLVKFEPPAE
jgi:hypothetical protein